jgi:hypothetical protein
VIRRAPQVGVTFLAGGGSVAAMAHHHDGATLVEAKGARPGRLFQPASLFGYEAEQIFHRADHGSLL